ncbi:MAG: energy transducer TonB [Candidatus Binatia bacterium]
MSRSSSTFGHYGGTENTSRPWATALFTSSVIYVGIGVVAAVVGVGNRQIATEKSVDVKFVEKVVMEEPPPHPAPKPIEEAKPPPPAVPKDVKVRKLEWPPRRKELRAPTEMPKEAPAEADPSQDKGIPLWKPDPAELEGGEGTGEKAEITEEVEGVVRAQPLKTNEPPPYPRAARNAGKTATVMLKIRITVNGRVEDVQVVEGEEPFTTAAVEAVKKWRYEPARYQGKPISVYRPIKVVFRLS